MTVSISDDAVFIPAINFTEVSVDPAAPGSGHALIYLKDGVLYVRRNTGDPFVPGGSPTLTENRLGVGSSGGLLSALTPGAEGAVPTRQADGTIAEVVPEVGGGGDYPGHIYLQCMAYDSYSGAAPSMASNAAVYGYNYVNQNSTVVGETMTWKLYLAAGTYTLRTSIAKGSTGGIQELSIGGSSIGTIDTYNSTPTYGTDWTITGIVVAASGLKDLVLSCTSKNGSATQYNKHLGSMSIWRTA